jgi:hypothetical protein
MQQEPSRNVFRIRSHVSPPAKGQIEEIPL